MNFVATHFNHAQFELIRVIIALKVHTIENFGQKHDKNWTLTNYTVSKFCGGLGVHTS